jgi:hypothetical protein
MAELIVTDELFYIQVGPELVYMDDQYLFPKDEADELYDKMAFALSEMINNGTKKERREAAKSLTNFRVIRLEDI